MGESGFFGLPPPRYHHSSILQPFIFGLLSPLLFPAFFKVNACHWLREQRSQAVVEKSMHGLGRHGRSVGIFSLFLSSCFPIFSLIATPDMCASVNIFHLNWKSDNATQRKIERMSMRNVFFPPRVLFENKNKKRTAVSFFSIFFNVD